MPLTWTVYKDGSCINALLWPSSFLILIKESSKKQLLHPLWKKIVMSRRNTRIRITTKFTSSYFPFPQTPLALFAAPPSSARQWLLPWRGWDARAQSEPKCWDPNGTRGACTLRVIKFIHSSRIWLMLKMQKPNGWMLFSIWKYFISYYTIWYDIIWHGHFLTDLNTRWNETEPFDHSYAKVTWT